MSLSPLSHVNEQTMGGDPGGDKGGGTRLPHYFGGGDGYGSVPPNNIYILWVTGFYMYCMH